MSRWLNIVIAFVIVFVQAVAAYGYDSEERLTAGYGRYGQAKVEYVYDALGRVSRTPLLPAKSVDCTYDYNLNVKNDIRNAQIYR